MQSRIKKRIFRGALVSEKRPIDYFNLKKNKKTAFPVDTMFFLWL
jgi:hypothetical protein